MSRISRATAALRDEILALKPKADVQTAGEPDGFGVYRALSVDEETREWLKPLIEEISDPRIEAVFSENKRLVVGLTGSLVTGEDISPFHLAEADKVVAAAAKEESSEEEGGAPAKKTAAKKAPAKKST